MTEASESEKSPFIPKDDDPGHEFTFKYLLMVPIILTKGLSYGLFLYVITDYTQSSIKNDTLGNRSVDIFSNLSECNSNKSDETYQLHLKIQQDTSTWLIYFNLAGNLPAIFSSILSGSYSDTIGRKALLYFSLSGTICKVIVIAFVIYFKLNYWIILFGYLVEGMTGQVLTFGVSCFAYSADITTPGRQRSLGILLIEAILGLSSAVGSLASGYYIESIGYFYSIVTCVGCNLFCFFLLICLPESLSKSRRTTSKSVMRIMQSSVQFYFGKDAPNRWKYDLFLICFIFISLGSVGRPALEALYQLGPPFCWSPDKIGIFGSIQNIGTYMVGLLLAKGFQKCISDEFIALAGIVSAISSLVVEALTQTDLLLYMVPVINVLSIATFPMVRSLMSVMTPADSQGALFAGLSTFQTACALVCSVLNNAVYSATVSIMNGLVFLVIAGYYLIGFITLLILTVSQSSSKDQSEHKKQTGLN